MAYEHNGVPIGRDAFYAIACDPRRSVAVEACAGAGKTWILVSRILRALLEGAEPHEILAITFTKKAAGEMRERLQEWLAAYADAPDLALDDALRQRGVDGHAAPGLRGALRSLQRRLLETGRPVQVRTFHSWFAALLRTAPLSMLEDLGFPASYELLEDDSEAIGLVWRRFHAAVAQNAPARRDFEDAVTAHGRTQTQKALHAALSKRVEFLLADQHGAMEASVLSAGALFPDFHGLETPEHLLGDAGVRQRWLARARLLGAEKNKTPQKAAETILLAFESEDPEQRFQMLRKAFFVADEDRLTVHLLKFVCAQEAEPELQALCAARAQHRAWQHHQRTVRLARLLIGEFAQLKRDRGWVDMNDVERAAQALLCDPVLSGWVQERLDARTRHLLIDEFQDTNPLQWQALSQWLSGYAGAGGAAGSAAGGAPSVFIVGDPKQSIYRFRRAEPQVFHAARRFIVQELGGDVLSCDHTHRNAPEVVAVVNRVMSEAQEAGEYAGFRAHTTESRVAGRVACLPQVKRPVPEQSDAHGNDAYGSDGQAAWRDSLTMPRETPDEKLVTLECRQAAAWIAQELARGCAPGDVMVLARRRSRLSVMEDELRALHITAQQPEKTELGEAPEVQDIVALLDVLVSPTHDLSLARALRSPLFSVPDAGLVELALAARRARERGQPQAWFELLQNEALQAPLLRGLAATLTGWKSLVDRLPPHDALETIYHEGDVLARFAAAAPAPLRTTVLANLRALLGAALQVGGARYATPYALVRALKSGGVRAPAVPAPGAVRLLTVHGAKGLEANTVLLLDTDGAPPRAESMGAIVEWPGEAPAPHRFAFLASESRPPACNADAMHQEFAARQREELNALYVAMTRARTQLVISSVQPHIEAPSSWWKRLAPLCVALPAPDAGRTALPDRPAVFSMPFVPIAGVQRSSVAIDIIATEDLTAVSTPASRFGEAVHRLLEIHIPGIDWTPTQRRRVARTHALSAGGLQEAVAMAERILEGEGAWAWDTGQVDWQANEVPLHHDGTLLRLDRLVRRKPAHDPAVGAQWWVLDFKSAARPERDALLIEKMRLYRRAVQALHPGEAVRAGFLTGQGRLVEIE